MDESVVEHFEQQQQTMKMSQAIRAGSRFTKQCSGSYYKPVGFACAIGAAALALGKGANDLHGEIFSINFAFYRATNFTINTANDRGWTREQIADKLEELGY